MPAADWEKRSVFARTYAACGNGTQAAIAAGVPETSAAVMAHRWLRNTEIVALVRDELDTRLRDLGPVAVDVVRQIMLDPAASPQTRLTAARDILDRLGWVPPRRAEVSLYQALPSAIDELSREELMAIAYGGTGKQDSVAIDNQDDGRKSI